METAGTLPPVGAVGGGNYSKVAEHALPIRYSGGEIQFPNHGNWKKFILTALCSDSSGFTQSRRFTQDDISQEWLETFDKVVSRIAVLSDEWKEFQAWVRLNQVIISPPLEEGEVSSKSRDGLF